MFYLLINKRVSIIVLFMLPSIHVFEEYSKQLKNRLKMRGVETNSKIITPFSSIHNFLDCILFSAQDWKWETKYIAIII